VPAAPLVVGLSSWIIQDGNYGDFRRGKQVAFALEFYASTDWVEVYALAPSLVHKGEGRYRSVGQVVHVADEWWAIDVGFLLFDRAKPPPVVRLGCWLANEISIGIDPFFYFESLAREADAPALIYDWTISKIEIQTAPSIWREIAATNAWEDEGGRAEYLLHCTRIEGPARRTRTKQG
jgi:hypothetical protein